MAAAGEQLFGNILLGSRSGAVSSPRPFCPAATAAATDLNDACWLLHASAPDVCCPLICSVFQAQGSLKASTTGLVWKRSGGGRTVEVPADGGSAQGRGAGLQDDGRGAFVCFRSS